MGDYRAPEVILPFHRTRGSAILWKLYLEFEIRAGSFSRAKKLLFRAIGECPLVKGMGRARISRHGSN